MVMTLFFYFNFKIWVKSDLFGVWRSYGHPIATKISGIIIKLFLYLVSKGFWNPPWNGWFTAILVIFSNLILKVLLNPSVTFKQVFLWSVASFNICLHVVKKWVIAHKKCEHSYKNKLAHREKVVFCRFTPFFATYMSLD